MTEQKKGCLVCIKKETCSFIKGFKHLYANTGILCGHFKPKYKPIIKEVVKFT